MRKALQVSFLTGGLLLGGLAQPSSFAAEADDVIARVGDETITFHDLDIIINSSGVIGIPMPDRGTRERTNMRLNLLDKAITVNLLYLDALDRGLDKNPVFQADEERFADQTLASMYRQKYLIGELPVSDDEIRDFFKKSYPADTPFTQDIHMAIESVIRKDRYKARLATLRERLREGVEVSVFEDRIDPSGDAGRSSTEVVAAIDGNDVVWGEVRPVLAPPVESAAGKSRREKLDEFIDNRIMTIKARAAGLAQESFYQQRLKEFRKTRLEKMRRTELTAADNPSDADLRDFYAKNRNKIAIPESRKIQMIVVQTPDEANELKQRIESGNITFFEAAADYSIDPNARMNLGELGWVAKGTGFPELDELTFSLKPDEIGGPVESPAGWHLVKALEIKPGQFEDINDPATLKRTRRMLLHDAEDRYVADLRKQKFKVEVYGDVFNRLTQQEVDARAPKQKPEAAAVSSD
jgi:parvulin-like peptidyl-prolyl isomerase